MSNCSYVSDYDIRLQDCTRLFGVDMARNRIVYFCVDPVNITSPVGIHNDARLSSSPREHIRRYYLNIVILMP